MARLMVAQIDWPEIIAGLVGGGGVSQIGNILINRSKAHAYAQGAVDRAMKSRDEALQRADERAKNFEERLEVVEGQHHQCETDLRDVNYRLDDALRELERLKAEGPAPGYSVLHRTVEPKKR